MKDTRALQNRKSRFADARSNIPCNRFDFQNLADCINFEWKAISIIRLRIAITYTFVTDKKMQYYNKFHIM